MAIKHEDVKISGDRGFASDWNKDHIIDGNVNFTAHKATNLTDPTEDQDASTKKYVDDRIAILKGTYYWSCPGLHFMAFSPNTDLFLYDGNGNVRSTSGTLWFQAPVFLPNGAVVTAAVVRASETAVVWRLKRVLLTGGFSELMAGGDLNTEDTTINYATIDNSTYSYWFETSTAMETYIFGARIKYTL